MHRLKLIISKLGVGGEAINRVCTGDGGDEGEMREMRKMKKQHPYPTPYSPISTLFCAKIKINKISD
jgi:hypothetical protein